MLVQYLPNLKTLRIARYVNTPHDYMRRNHPAAELLPSGAVTEGPNVELERFSTDNLLSTPIDRFFICQSMGVHPLHQSWPDFYIRGRVMERTRHREAW
ncbi:MAG: hypothetical protein M5U09_28035 [Gammaproteobacteria bacterium]|nr:hypothetical protein [Gammaproteobacteria bacterium]